MAKQWEKGNRFRDLHLQSEAFVVPNPWDVGTAQLLAHVGFQAMATTSAGFAFSMGRADYAISRDEMIAHVGLIASATDLPVTADLESGYGENPSDVAETIRLAAMAGVVGGSIEDATNLPENPIREISAAVDRVRAAVEAARSLAFPFTLTARAENYLWNRPDLKDTIARLQAFQDAGADVLFAPGLTSKEDIAQVVRSVDRPVNVILGIKGATLTVSELSAIGVRRISVGSSLSRAALGSFLRAAREIHDHGTFTYTADAVPYLELNAMFKK